MEHRLEKRCIKNETKIKIDEFFFVEIEKKKSIQNCKRGSKLKKTSKIRIKIEEKVDFVLK